MKIIEVYLTTGHLLTQNCVPHSHFHASYCEGMNPCDTRNWVKRQFSLNECHWALQWNCLMWLPCLLAEELLRLVVASLIKPMSLLLCVCSPQLWCGCAALQSASISLSREMPPGMMQGTIARYGKLFSHSQLKDITEEAFILKCWGFKLI